MLQKELHNDPYPNISLLIQRPVFCIPDRLYGSLCCEVAPLPLRGEKLISVGQDLDGTFPYTVPLQARLGRLPLRLWVNTPPPCTEDFCDECRVATTSCLSWGLVLTLENQKGPLGKPQHAIRKPQSNPERGMRAAPEASS